MPALAKARQVAGTMTSGSNLAAIGNACATYASDHNGQYPANLEELVEKAGLSPECLESRLKPMGFVNPSYIYITGQSVAMAPENIITYENPAYCVDKVNVLFNNRPR